MAKKFKKLTVGSKIRLGFGIVLSLLILLTVWSYIGTGKVTQNAEIAIYGNQLDSLLAQKEIDHLNWARQVTELLTNDELTTLDVETDHRQCSFGRWLNSDQRTVAENLVPDLIPLLKKIEEPHKNLHASAVEIQNNYRYIDHRLGWFLREKKSDLLAWLHRLKDGLLPLEGGRIKINTNPRKCRLGIWIYSQETNNIKKGDSEFASLVASLESAHKMLHKSAIEINRALADGDRAAAFSLYKKTTETYADKAIAALDGIRDWHDGIIELEEDTQSMYAYETIPALIEMQELFKKIRHEAKDRIMSDHAMLNAAKSSKTSVLFISAVALIIGFILAFFISRGIIGALKSITSLVEQSATRVATASRQISSANQILANGASDQAASIEETSSSLEEMSSMTTQNAENAGQADSNMRTAIEIIDASNHAVVNMQESMDDITRASEETFKIIKTIDEIAFQTNLLALNAAVEAARAGEAGAGFAVVADEVRNLAIRAADAAKTTADLIEGTVKKVNGGSDLVKQISESFAGVATNASNVGNLVSEIAAASNEQALGIGQISLAVNEMDKIVQQNAANAEESTDAAEELNRQAGKMQVVVEDLSALVGASTKVEDQPAGNLKESLIDTAHNLIASGKDRRNGTRSATS